MPFANPPAVYFPIQTMAKLEFCFCAESYQICVSATATASPNSQQQQFAHEIPNINIMEQRKMPINIVWMSYENLIY